ncbi:MAG TPA: DUF1573 domain-containing protein [Chitinophagaceae bacterium]|nr:DUF1573 domain-containing protein [Chitinophagaceae bacterium]
MKKVLIVLLAAASVAACKSGDKKMTDAEIAKQTRDSLANNGILTADTANNANKAVVENTTIEWLDSTYTDLGKQKEGKEIEITYRFKNTGTKNLIIQSVSAQCGCTIPEKPEQPFAPGEEGVIKAKYNGSGHGETRKEIYVTANTTPAPSHTLVFRTELIK